MKTPTPQNVLVFQAENTMPQEQFRTRRIQQGLGVERLPDRIFYAPPMWPCSVKNKEFFDYALKRIEECRATVVFFDPLISYHNENENDNVKMRGVLNCFTHMSRDTGASCILLHHFGKPSIENAPVLEYRMRGAQAIRDWCDTAITISALKDQSGKRTLRRLDFIKIRNGPWHAPIVLERDGPFIHEVTEEPGKCPPSLVARVMEKHGARAGSPVVADRRNGGVKMGWTGTLS
jgi:hypothetical protein